MNVLTWVVIISVQCHWAVHFKIHTLKICDYLKKKSEKKKEREWEEMKGGMAKKDL